MARLLCREGEETLERKGWRVERSLVAQVLLARLWGE